jgi:26S proteasome regulatory subunit N6
MILDKKLAGTLDQGAGCLEVFAPESRSQLYEDALSIMDKLGSVVDTLYGRSQSVLAAV